MNNTVLKSKILSNFVWKWGERTSVQIVKFIVQLVLARILLPEEYGLIAIISVFIVLADVIVQSGLNTALIQKDKVDRKDYSSVLTVSCLLAIVMYSVMFVVAPYIARYYNEELLTPVIRVLSLNLFSGAINSIQIAYISRSLQFKLNFISSLIAILISGVIGITLALYGKGVWAMVAQQLTNQYLVVFIMAILIRKKPSIGISFDRINRLFGFGWKVMLSSVVATLTENLYNLFIGKLYNTETVGYYNRGAQFPTVICASANTTISSVLLPIMSGKQDSLIEIKEITRKSIMFCSFLILPILAGLIAVSEPLVIILLTEKWLKCVPFLRLECLFYATLPLMYADGQAARALGKSEIGLKIELAKTAITLIGILLFFKNGVLIIVALRAVISAIIVVVQCVINKRLINYTYKERIKDIIPSMLSAIFMGLVIYSLSMLELSTIVTLIIQVIVGIILYAVLSAITKNQAMMQLLKIVQDRRNRK